MPLRHAKATRSPVREGVAEEDGDHGRLLRRDRDDAAIPPPRRRRVDGGRLFRPDLRQHADGIGHAQTLRPGGRLRNNLLSAQPARDDRSGRPGRAVEDRRLRPDRARAVDDADEGILHAPFFGARRMRARTALREIPLGRRAQRQTLLALPEDGHRRRLLKTAKVNHEETKSTKIFFLFLFRALRFLVVGFWGGRACLIGRYYQFCSPQSPRFTPLRRRIGRSGADRTATAWSKTSSRRPNGLKS